MLKIFPEEKEDEKRVSFETNTKNCVNAHNMDVNSHFSSSAIFVKAQNELSFSKYFFIPRILMWCMFCLSSSFIPNQMNHMSIFHSAFMIDVFQNDIYLTMLWHRWTSNESHYVSFNHDYKNNHIFSLILNI